MALFSINGVAVRGLAAAVPLASVDNSDYDWISEQERNMLISTTGIKSRRVASRGTCTSDLCKPAAEKLLTDLGWKATEIDLLVFVSQSRDYILPATAIILQNELGLPKSSVAFDISLGCSGYVYGLSTVVSMMKSCGLKKALFMVGDISTISLNPRDKSTFPLFGDAGTVTALEISDESSMHFNLGSDGSGHKAIMIQDGGARQPYSVESEIEQEISQGIWRKGTDLILDGLEVFSFSIREVPPNVAGLLGFAHKSNDDIDLFVMHQANLLMNETIRKKLKFPAEKVPYSLKSYGNTSSASIPLTMVTQCREKLTSSENKLLLSGFGVGLSWGSVILSTNNLVIPELIEI